MLQCRTYWHDETMSSANVDGMGIVVVDEEKMVGMLEDDIRRYEDHEYAGAKKDLRSGLSYRFWTGATVNCTASVALVGNIGRSVDLELKAAV